MNAPFRPGDRVSVAMPWFQHETRLAEVVSVYDEHHPTGPQVQIVWPSIVYSTRGPDQLVHAPLVPSEDDVAGAHGDPLAGGWPA